MSAEIKYNGETLETLNGGEYVTLHTKGKTMEDDIRVEVAEASGGDIAINGIVEQYKVNAGATVNAGDFVEFVNKFGNGTLCESPINSAFGVSACKLDNNRVLVAYNTNSVGNAVVLTMGDTGITVGAPVVFNERVTKYISAVALSDSKVLVAFASGTYATAYAFVLTINHSTITVGKGTIFRDDTGTVVEVCAVALTDSKVLAVSRVGSYRQAVVLTISDAGITVGAKKQFGDNLAPGTSAVALAEDKVLVINGVGKNVSAIVLTISGTAVTDGVYYALYTDGGSNAEYMCVVALSDSKALAIYRDSANSLACTAVVLTINGTSMSLGTAVAFRTGATSYISAVALSDSKVLVTYAHSSYGRAIVLTIDGTTITAGAEKVFDYNTVIYSNTVVALSETSALAVYNNGVGAYTTLSIDGTTITTDSAEIGTYVQPATSRLHNVGVAKTSGTEGQMVDVYCV